MTPQAFRKKVNSSLFKLFLLQQLPMAFLAGVKIETFTAEHCTTSIRFKWLNKNPFRSLYFAVLEMAAELSTGLQLFQYINSENKFSMLLVANQAQYHKKAIGKIRFVCEEGSRVNEFVEQMMQSDEGSVIELNVKAYSQEELVAEFSYTWSCKKKQGPEVNSRP